MKKVTAGLIGLIFVFTLFIGCAREEFTDLYGFTEDFTYTQLGPEDFYAEKSEGVYYTFFEKDNPKIMLKLIYSNENKIDEVRIFLPKYDENAKIKVITTDEILLFTRVIRSSVQAFTGYAADEAEKLTDQMCLSQKKTYENEGELTKTKDNFHFVYLSSSTGSEFIIYNTYLKAVPKTEKPESRPIYGDTTKIRNETVPTK